MALSSTTKSALQIVRMPLPIASRLLFSEESNHESGVRSLNVFGRAISDTSRDKTAKPTSKGERRSLRSGSLAAALKRRRISTNATEPLICRIVLPFLRRASVGLTHDGNSGRTGVVSQLGVRHDEVIE